MKNAMRSKRLLREGSWIVLGQALAVIGTLLSIRFLTERLQPSDYGELALGISIATLVNQIILGPLSGGIMRFFSPASESGDLERYFQASKKLVCLATLVIFLLIIFVTFGLIIFGYAKWIGLTISALVFATISGYVVVIAGIQTASRQRAIVALHQGAEPIIRLIITVIFIVALGANSVIAILGYAVASLLILVSQLFFFRKAIHIAPSKNTNKNWYEEIWKFSWPIGMFGVFTWLQLASDRWALQAFSSTSEVGNYAVLYQLGYYPISLITGMLMQFIVPILYQRAGDTTDMSRNRNATRLCWQIFWITLVITGLASLVALYLHTFIFQILVAKEYITVSYLLPWIILSGGVFAAGQALATNLQTKLKTQEMITAKITTAILGLVLNFISAYYFKITGVVFSGLLFSVTFLVWMIILVNRENKRECL